MKADFSWNGKPAGKTRGKLKGVLKAGEEKTFENVRLGIMNFDTDSVSLKVVGAKAKSKKEKVHPLSVTGWDWRAGGYGGAAGTISSITVKNPSPSPYGRVEFAIVQKSAGKKVLSHSVIMDKIADANTETVYKNVNQGFIHPSTDEIEVSVRSAYPVSEKQAALMGKDGTQSGNLKTSGSEDAAKIAVPGYDIEIKDFEWGSGVAGSFGIIKSLVLANRSAIRYEEVIMSVEFLSRNGSVLTSNSFKIKNPPAPAKTAEFKNVKVGILSVSPDKDFMRVFVKGGKPAN